MSTLLIQINFINLSFGSTFEKAELNRPKFFIIFGRISIGIKVSIKSFKQVHFFSFCKTYYKIDHKVIATWNQSRKMLQQFWKTVESFFFSLLNVFFFLLNIFFVEFEKLDDVCHQWLFLRHSSVKILAGLLTRNVTMKQILFKT
jgi:hypothetical protein